MNAFIETFNARQGQLLNALFEHIQLSFTSLFFAVIISIPLGIYLTRHKKAAESVIGVTAVLQTIPSLALLGLLIPLFGIGTLPAIIALVAYALLPIIRNTYTGIKEVDASLIEAATAMGMNTRKRLLKVELPLAMPVIMAGIRTAMVLIIGTATLAALIGAGGLGDIILLGIDRNNTSLIFLGAIPAAILAILFDLLLRKLEKIHYKFAILTVGIIVLTSLLFTIVPTIINQTTDELIIAGKRGPEPEILTNMYQELIEQDTDLTVRIRPGLGGTSFVFSALVNDEIDIYPEFTGTVLGEIINEQAVNNNREDVFEQAREGIFNQHNMVLLGAMDFNNTYALAVPMAFRDEHELETISDLSRVIDEIRAGFTLEFSDREDGYLGLQDTYGFAFNSVQTMEPALRYNAIERGDINLIDAYSTDAEIEFYNLYVLEDDLDHFPPYQGAPLLKQETLDEYPELEDILNQLEGQITDDDMRRMNYEVTFEDADANQVARDFLEEIGLLR